MRGLFMFNMLTKSLSCKFMIKAKLKAAFFHFLFTLLVAVISATFIFFIWYPEPYTSISGGMALWRILISVELSLGPLMSLVIYNPRKNLRHLLLDYSIVAIFQVSALCYGIYTLYTVRPLFMVFVKDRFELVNANDLEHELPAAKLLRRGWVGPTILGVRKAESASERDELMFDTVSSGRDIHLRPKYYAMLDRVELNEAVKPINELLDSLKSPKYKELREEIAESDDSCKWIPVVNGLNYWLAVLDGELNVVKFYPIDPWELTQFSD